mgnify:CR=1 FL=1
MPPRKDFQRRLRITAASRFYEVFGTGSVFSISLALLKLETRLGSSMPQPQSM